MEATGIDQAAWYFSALFGDEAWAGYSVIWSLPSKGATFCASVDQAVARAMELAKDGEDVYCGVGLYRSGIRRGRGTATDVVAIPALWCDLDYGPEHAKPNTPPTEVEARRILNSVGIKPSFVVHSGHGLHAYWCLKEPLTADEGAAAVAKRWSDTVVARGSALGFAVDAVGDLSRVLRVPGTINHKNAAEPLPVRLVATDDVSRYTVDDLEAYMIDVGPAPSPKMKAPDVGDLILTADRWPDGAILDAGLDNDPKFRRTWTHNRTDLGDQSPSAYDLAVACWAAAHGLTDQQIADAVIGFRRKHRHDLTKILGRPDYVRGLITKARTAYDRTISDVDAVREAEVDGKFAGKGSDEMLRTLRSQLGLPLSRVIRRGMRDARWSLELDDGTEIVIGPTATMLDPGRFRAAVFDGTMPGRVIPRFKHDVWGRIIEALTQHVVNVRMPDADDRVNGWLDEYVQAHQPHDDEHWAQALPNREAFTREDQLWFSCISFGQWIRVSRGERIDTQDLRAALHALGYAGQRVTAKIGGGQVGRYYWAGPLPAELRNNGNPP